MLGKYLRNAFSLLFIIFFLAFCVVCGKNSWIAVYARRELKEKKSSKGCSQKRRRWCTSTNAVDIEWEFINLLRRLSQHEIFTEMLLARAMVNSFVERDNMKAFEQCPTERRRKTFLLVNWSETLLKLHRGWKLKKKNLYKIFSWNLII